MMSVRCLLAEFNFPTAIVLLISLIYFWHLVFHVFYVFLNFLLLLLLPYGLWALWLNIHTNWFGDCTSCFYPAFDWHLACPTAECMHTVGMMIGVSIAAAASQGLPFTWYCQTTVNYVCGHEFPILFMISFEITYSSENQTHLLHWIFFSSSIGFVPVI